MRIIKYVKSEHYITFHEQETPWHLVVPLIAKSKIKKKVGNKIKIITEGYYFLCEFENGALIVINAKRI